MSGLWITLVLAVMPEYVPVPMRTIVLNLRDRSSFAASSKLKATVTTPTTGLLQYIIIPLPAKATAFRSLTTTYKRFGAVCFVLG